MCNNKLQYYNKHIKKVILYAFVYMCKKNIYYKCVTYELPCHS